MQTCVTYIQAEQSDLSILLYRKERVTSAVRVHFGACIHDDFLIKEELS